METPIFIAQILTVYYLSVAVGFLLNGEYYRKEFLKAFDSVLFMFYGGIIALMFGLLILHFHNTWNNDWTVLITIIGWIATIKGVTLIAFPKSLNWFKKLLKPKGSLNWMGAVVLLMGIVFGYFGFVI